MNAAKIKVIRIITAVNTPVKLGTNKIEDLTTFIYLGSKISIMETRKVKRLVNVRRGFDSLRKI